MRVLGGRIAADAGVVSGVFSVQLWDRQGAAERIHLSDEDASGLGNRFL